MKNTDDVFPSQMQPLNPKASSDKNSLLSTGFQATTTTYNSIEIRKNNLDEEESIAAADSQQQDAHKTTVYQTFVHLLKGYMGAGCLSLPWAISQLGFFYGPLAIIVVSYWSSYNCWTIVKLKRFIEKETEDVDDKASVASSVTTNTQVTYAAVGEFFYGAKFESYVAACVCIQQLAICTVFISFVGENLLAVQQSLGITFMATHTGVMTLEMPLILGLSLIPNLKSLSPVMAIGTFLLMITFAAIGIIIHQVWEFRPPAEEIQMNWAGAPLAVCAILYSYEGINLILPVESAMLEPKYFKIPFVLSMMSVAFILCSFSVICVLAFGNVTSGSVTAFLIEAYPDDPEILGWLMVANTAVSLSVLMTYPLQLFPALELLGPSFSKFLSQEEEKDDLDDDDDLSAFEPLPPLPEHGVADVEEWDDHQYEVEEEPEDIDIVDTKDDNNSVTFSAISSTIHTVLPEFTMPGDSPLLRVLLVLLTYLIAVIVPNVQSLISLAGALAGSSSALLIPPMLELAWIKHLEEAATPQASQAQAANPLIPEPVQDMAIEDSTPFSQNWYDKGKCYILLVFGFLFFLIGTLSSIADIVRIYVEE